MDYATFGFQNSCILATQKPIFMCMLEIYTQDNPREPLTCFDPAVNACTISMCTSCIRCKGRSETISAQLPSTGISLLRAVFVPIP